MGRGGEGEGRAIERGRNVMCIDPDRAIRESNGEDIVVGIRLDSKGDRGLLEVNSSQKSTIGDIKYYELI